MNIGNVENGASDTFWGLLGGVMGSSEAPAAVEDPASPAVEGEKEAAVALNELQLFKDKFIEDLTGFRENYPLIATIVTVVSTLFGTVLALSLFSPVNVLTGVSLLTFSFCMGKNIYRSGLLNHLKTSWTSLMTIWGQFTAENAKRAQAAAEKSGQKRPDASPLVAEARQETPSS